MSNMSTEWEPFYSLSFSSPCPKFVVLESGLTKLDDGCWNSMGTYRKWFFSYIDQCVIKNHEIESLLQQCIAKSKEYFGQCPNKHSLYSHCRLLAKHFFPAKPFPFEDPDPIYSEIFEEYFWEQNCLRGQFKADDPILPKLLRGLGMFFESKLNMARNSGMKKAHKIYECDLESNTVCYRKLYSVGPYPKGPKYFEDFVDMETEESTVAENSIVAKETDVAEEKNAKEAAITDSTIVDSNKDSEVPVCYEDYIIDSDQEDDSDTAECDIESEDDGWVLA